MSRSRTTRLAITVLTCVGLLGISAPAQASWTDNVRYKRQFSVCTDTGSGLDVGAGMFMKELGKHGVVGMRTKFLLYGEDPNGPGIHQSVGRMTKRSAAFPNDERNFFYDANQGDNEHTFHVSYGEWWIVAKLTWDRNNRRDWNVKVPAAYCSFTG
jgi:hypothetical protein